MSLCREEAFQLAGEPDCSRSDVGAADTHIERRKDSLNWGRGCQGGLPRRGRV
jgi:hypothetical protein